MIGLDAIAEKDPSDEQADRLRVQSFRELVVSRLRDEEIRRRHPTGYDKNHASMWLITQADLLFVVMEYFPVEVGQRLHAITAIEGVVGSSMGKWNAHIYAVARILHNLRRCLQRGPPFEAWLAFLHLELLHAGETLQLTDSAWMRLLDGMWRLGNGTENEQFFIEVASMSPGERRAFSELVSKAASVLEELNLRAGMPVNEFFILSQPDRLLRSPVDDEDTLTDRIRQYTSLMNLIDSDVEKEKVLRRAAMFARWSHVTPVRERYTEEFYAAVFLVSTDLSWIDWWAHVDAFIEAVSLGQRPAPLSHFITDRFIPVWTDQGMFDMGKLLRELAPPEPIMSRPACPMTRLEVALDQLSQRDERLSDLMRAGIANLDTELSAHAQRSLVDVIEFHVPQGVLSLAFHFGLYTGGKLLANVRALDGISEERLKKFRIIVSSWLNFNIRMRMERDLIHPMELYLLSPDRTEEEVDRFASAMRLLTTASKDFEARQDAIFEFPGFGIFEAADLGPVAPMIEKLNTLLPPAIFNRYNLRVPPELRANHQSSGSMMALLEPTLGETSRVYRTSLWPALERIMPFLPEESDIDDPGEMGELIARLPYFIHYGFYVNGAIRHPQSGMVASTEITITTDILAVVDLFANVDSADPEQAEEFLSIVLEFRVIAEFPDNEDLIDKLQSISERIKVLRVALESPNVVL